MIQPDYFIVMIDYGKPGREAIVDPQDNWSDVIDRVREAQSDGFTVSFVHHVHDGTVEDRSEEAFEAAVLASSAQQPRNTIQHARAM